jgi:hypothetical protein
VRFGCAKCEDAAVFDKEHVVLSEIEAEAIDREKRSIGSVPSPRPRTKGCFSSQSQIGCALARIACMNESPVVIE